MKLNERYISAIIMAIFTLIGCSEDEVPKIGFTTGTSEVFEGSTVSVPLSAAIPNGVSPIINFTGTATEDVDFTWAVSADGRELVFETFADEVFDDETIIIEITGFNGDAKIGSILIHTINVQDPLLNIGFTSTTSDVVEGSIVSVPLSVAIPSGITPILSITGTAAENIDYEWAVSADGGELVFETFHDNVFDDETVIIEITGFSDGANVGTTVIHTINISDPGLNAVLTWTMVDGGSADLDLILFRETSTGSGQYTEIGGSFGIGNSETFVLRGDEINAKYAFAVEYFSGTSDDIDFTLTLSTTAGTVNTNAKTISFSGTLRQFNLDAELANVIFTKNNLTYSGFSNLFVPVAPPEIPLDITLSWNAGAATAGDVDMDLYLFYFNPATGLYETIDTSLSGSSPTETVTLPGDAPNGTYGLRYKYYSGSSNTLSFTSTFVVGAGGSFTGTTNNTVAFNGSYTLSNVNSGASSNISQTFVKNGTTFGNFTTITTPVSGSRAQFEEGYTDDKNEAVAPKKSKLARTSIKKEKGLKGVTLNLNK